MQLWHSWERASRREGTMDKCDTTSLQTVNRRKKMCSWVAHLENSKLNPNDIHHDNGLRGQLLKQKNKQKNTHVYTQTLTRAYIKWL